MRESKNMHVRKVEQDARRRGGYAKLAQNRHWPDHIMAKRHAGEAVTYLQTHIIMHFKKLISK